MLLYEAILIATLTLTAWFKYKGQEPFPFFLPFMVMVVFFELIAESLFAKRYITNYPVMNLYAKFCIYYYLFVLFHFFRDRQWIGIFRILIIVFIIMSLVWHFAFHDQDQIDYMSYNLGFMFLFPSMLRYLYEVIYNRPYFNVFSDPYFYFIFGLLLFYTSAFPLLGFINLLITNNPEYEAYYDLLNIGNIFLSLAYLGAALCSKPRTQSILSS